MTEDYVSHCSRLLATKVVLVWSSNGLPTSLSFLTLTLSFLDWWARPLLKMLSGASSMVSVMILKFFSSFGLANERISTFHPL